MKRYLITLCCLAVSLAAHAALIPTTELSHEAAFKGFTISPDGKAVAYSETIKGNNLLKIINLETGERVGVDLVGDNLSWNHGSSFFWINDDRLIYWAKRGYEVIDRDGKNGKTLGGQWLRLDGGNRFKFGAIVHAFRHSKDGYILIQNINATVRDASAITQVTYDYTRPGLAQVSAKTDGVSLQEINPGNIRHWLVNSEGQVRGAQEIDGTRYRVVYREFEKSGWKALPGMDWNDPQVLPLGFGKEDSVLYVSRLNEHGLWAVYPYDLTTKKLGPVILEDKSYDIIPQTDASGQAGMIYSPDQKQLLGIRYLTAYPRVYWLDEGLSQVQAGLDQALEGKVNDITSMSDDLQKLIVHSWSDRDPGTYYFFDREKQALSVLMMSTPWIKPDQMAQMRPLKYEARDGVTIHGYMSLPVDQKPANLPVVLLIDSDFWTRNTWYFDRTVQFLANRGYAVLRLNPRGTTGYGDPFKRMGYLQTKESIADLADGVKWAIGKGLVDPKRVAIMGTGGMEGMRALTALALDPDLYACAVVNSPYTNWEKVIDPLNKVGDYLAIYYERIGNPANANDPINSLSPINLVDQIKAPVLVTETAEWKPNHYTYEKRFVKALEKSGSPVEFQTKYNAKYGFENYAQWLEETVAFMNKHMPANQ